jgi:cytochrome c oxidase subunit 2
MSENQLAEKQDMNDAVAVNVENLSPSEFLHPYLKNLPVTPANLESLANQF